MVNKPMKPIAYSMGVENDSDPLYIVAVQLKTLIAEGTATRKLRNENTSAAYSEMPATNIWCAQTRNPITAMAMLDIATKLYPNTRLREKQVTISLMMPMDGKIMMYTAGCE